MINAILGTKSHMTQGFTPSGRRVVASVVKTGENLVTQIKTLQKDGYSSLQLGTGQRKPKHTTKPLQGHLKKSISNLKFKISNYQRYLREVSAQDSGDSAQVNIGDVVKASDVFKAGDVVKVTGTSKGKGFAGVVKRHHFAGGPKTHGQSDRHRAPGSIGQGTTPGRVYKGKRMAGRMGGEQVAVRGLTVIRVDEDSIWLSGPVPGNREGLLLIEKIGEAKNFEGLHQAELQDTEARDITQDSQTEEEK